MATVGDPPGQWALATRQPRFMSPMDGCQRHQDPMGRARDKEVPSHGQHWQAHHTKRKPAPKGWRKGGLQHPSPLSNPTPSPISAMDKGGGLKVLEGEGQYLCIGPASSQMVLQGKGWVASRRRKVLGQDGAVVPPPRTHCHRSSLGMRRKTPPPPGLPPCLSQAPHCITIGAVSAAQWHLCFH